MTTLQRARATATTWPIEHHSPWFAPLRPQLAVLARFAAWPSVKELDAALAPWLSPHRVRLVEQPAQRERRQAATMYEVAAERGEVLTRPGNLHDLLNALTWARYPLSKLSLSSRLATLQRDRLRADGSLPGRRAPEHDRLAMLDEGGVIVSDEQAPRAWLFGHALLEHLCLGRELPRAARLLLPVPTGADTLDEDLAAAIASGLSIEAGPGIAIEDAWQQRASAP